ncbi:MAG: HAMP domain-containing sensor histidine kinase [Candidatus Omnitrophota bacterium]
MLEKRKINHVFAIDALREQNIDLKKRLKVQEWDARKTKESIKILYKELEEKNKELLKLSQSKSQFVANVSHEFKSPLTVIKEYLEVMIDEEVGKINPGQKKMLKRAKDTVDRLARLVTNLLDLSKIESGKVTLRMQKINIANLIKEILDGYERKFSKRQIVLEKELEDNVGEILVDKDKISEVFINILDNVVKYSPKKKKAYVKLKKEKKGILIEVADTGRGIPKKYQAKIFSKFERFEPDKCEGAGLGLSIAKDIIELHKGKIWVESREGKGTRFIFTLPLNEA